MKFFSAILLVLLVVLAPYDESVTAEPEPGSLRFDAGPSGTFSFDTGELSGKFRLEGKSVGLVPVTFHKDSIQLTAGEGLFNHYRVFTRGVRYGYGARRWHSTAELKEDGSVVVHWPSTPERPFQLSASYRWVAPNTLDMVTTVKALEDLEDFEVFLASYYTPGFTDSRVHSNGFVKATKELGEWLAFPRDPGSAELIGDGRWDLGSSPIEWTMMPAYDYPLAYRRDMRTGTTVVVMAKREDCFGIFTPYGEEKHYSNYLSLFGYDIEVGSSARAHTRLVVLSDPAGSEIEKAYKAFHMSALQ